MRYFARTGCVVLWAMVVVGCERPILDQGQPNLVYDPAAFPAELEGERHKFEATRRDFIALTPQPGGPAGSFESHFMGTPYWPAYKKYPIDKDGAEMILLAQINFADMPLLDDYPESGILQFFISGSEHADHIWGMSMDHPDPWDPARYAQLLTRDDYFRVIFHKTVDSAADQRDSFPRPARHYMPIDRPMTLSADLRSEVVYPADYQFASLIGEDVYAYFDRLGPEAADHLDGFYTATNDVPAAKIGGYGDFVQEDPRVLMTDEDWVILLWIDSFSTASGEGALWGDAGTAVFAIERDALKYRDFSKVLYSWDSH